ncbi:MAG: hypothetical protein QF437_22255, partial [Planctomycetota bacterium]|nr:hypothetical protein [Planctomycetota bacterium]
MYAGYDRENLYFCYRSPVYPVGSWMKARGRFPDVLEHPLYGILFDDHKEIELRPLGDLNRGYQIGMLRWDVNPIGTYNDWFMSRDTGRDLKYSSRAMIRSVVDDRYWVIEYAIPFKSLRYRGYDGKDKDGRPMVQIPPANGTVYRAWFARGLGRAGALFNAFDQHGWNTTKMKLIFDSKSPVFQINELGPIMEGKIDLHMTVKNHNDRSEMVRIGFHVESPSGPLYSSYQSEDIRDGLLELRPGEVRKLRLKHQLVGVASDGNTFWFDVRSVGESVKSLFRSRLVGFHMMDGGVAGTPPLTFRERRLDVIKELRPKRVPYFDLRVTVSPYNRRLAAVIDRGIAGVKEEIKTATNAQLHVRHLGKDDEVVHTASAPFIGDFAIFDIQVPELLSGESYEVTVLAFNQNMRIVGEQTETKPFFNLTQGADAATPAGRGERFNLAPWMKTVPKDDPARMYYTPGKEKDKRKGFFESPPWLGLEDGLEDRVWEPFTAIKQTDNGFETLKHRFTIDGSGLPAQIDIRPDPRELPLELRGQDAIVPAETLTEIGRGPQLREPLRLEAVIKGKRVPASVVSRARAMRVGKSEIEYTSKLRIGPIEAELRTQYDCDGSLHAKMVYGSDAPAAIERLELVADVSGRVDLMLSETGNGPGFTGADRGECTLPNKTGVLWDSTLTKMPLFYSRFVPWFWFGSADRGWSYYSSGDEGWILDRDGSAMQIERNESGDVTWRVVFINHPAEVKGRRTIDFSILTHPAKPKPVNFRRNAWHYCAGEQWASQGRLQLDWGAEPDFVPWSYSEENFLKRWRTAANAPADIPEYHREGWRGVDPPYRRWGLGTAGSFFLPEKDRLFQDKALYYLERYIRLGRRLGLWMGDYSPP